MYSFHMHFLPCFNYSSARYCKTNDNSKFMLLDSTFIFNKARIKSFFVSDESVFIATVSTYTKR